MCAHIISSAVWWCRATTRAASRLRSEFFYFGAAERLLCLETFHLLSFPPRPAGRGCYCGTLWGRRSSVWCWAAAALAYDISLFPLVTKAKWPFSDRRAGRARCSLLTLLAWGHLGRPNSDLWLIPQRSSDNLFQLIETLDGCYQMCFQHRRNKKKTKNSTGENCIDNPIVSEHLSYKSSYCTREGKLQ